MSVFDPKRTNLNNDIWQIRLEIYNIKHTFFGVQSKLPNIKEALTIPISPRFYTQLFAKYCMFGRSFLQPNSFPFRSSFRNIWQGKASEIEHKGKEHGPHGDLYVVVNATHYFPCFG